MTVTRRQYTGTAAPTKLSASMAAGDASFTVVTGGGNGYPTGVNNFVITVDLGLSTEEKILCSARVADSFTVAGGGRGFDGTTAQSHASGATVNHTLSAVDMDQVNQHGADVSQDDHTQYMRTDGTRHDVNARHLIGTTLAAPGFPTFSNPNDVAATGAATAAARGDHRHGREALTTYLKDLRGHIFDTATANTLSIQATLYLIPFMAYAATTISGFSINVNVGGSAGSVIRVGLYQGNGASGGPSTLMIDGGTLVSTGAGNLNFTFTQQSLPPGLYWLAVAPQGAPATSPTLLMNNNVNQSPFVTHPSTPQLSGAGYAASGQAGALPAPVTGYTPIAAVPLCFAILS